MKVLNLVHKQSETMLTITFILLQAFGERQKSMAKRKFPKLNRMKNQIWSLIWSRKLIVGNFQHSLKLIGTAVANPPSAVSLNL